MIQYTSHTPSNRGVFAVFELTVRHFTIHGQNHYNPRVYAAPQIIRVSYITTVLQV